MFSTLMIMILWTWGLTPLWVNITGTVLIGIRMFFIILKSMVKLIRE